MTALLDAGVTAFTSVQTALSPTAPLQVGTATFTAVSTAASAAAATIAANLSAADTAALKFIPGALPITIGVTPIDPSSVLAGSATPNVTAAAVEAMLTALQDVAGLSNMQGYIYRIVANLANASA